MNNVLNRLIVFMHKVIIKKYSKDDNKHIKKDIFTSSSIMTPYGSRSYIFKTKKTNNSDHNNP